MRSLHLATALVFLPLVVWGLIASNVHAQDATMRQYAPGEVEYTAEDKDISDLAAFKEQILQPYETLDFNEVETGILYDRVNVFSDAGQHTGRGAASLNYSEWKQLYLEMQLGQVRDAVLPELDDIKAAAKNAQDDAVPIVVMSLEYNKIKESSFGEGLLRRQNGQLHDVSGSSESPYARRNVFAAAAAKEILNDKTVTFELSRDFYVDNQSSKLPDYFEIDLGEGNGFRRVSFGDRLTTRYTDNGKKTARLRAHFSSGDTKESVFTFEVQAYSMPSCDLTWGTPGSTQRSDFAVSDDDYKGEPAYFTACAHFAEGHSSLRKPLIFAEGFDRNGQQNIAFLYSLLAAEGIPDALSSMGYDLVILNYYDATTHIQRNSQSLITLLRDINEQKTTREPNVVIGASMGGLVARYALSLMETNGEEHEATTYISFDSPHLGANIPLSLQYTVYFFSLINDAADDALEDLDSPAARQMLVYHWRSSNNELPKPDPLRLELDGELNSNNDGPNRRYPEKNEIWKVAISNGSGHARAQRNINGDVMPSGEDALLYAFDKHVFGYNNTVRAYAVPEGGERSLLFYGLHEKPPADHVTLTRYIDAYDPPSYPTSKPYDNAPGGYTTTAQEIVELSESEGDARTSWERHGFIPTISALDLRPVDLFYDVAAESTLPNKQPLGPRDELGADTAFEILRYAYQNEEHVDVSNVASFLLEQIDYVLPTRTIANETISTRKPLLRSRTETEVENVTLTSDADVVLASGGTIRLRPGFQAEENSQFRAYVDPTLSEPSQANYAIAAAKEESTSNAEGGNESSKDVEDDASKKLTRDHSSAEAFTFSLEQNYPNPFATTTTIRFSLPEASEASLVVYDMLGRKVDQLVNRKLEAGYHNWQLDASRLPSGLYVYQLRAGEHVDRKHMVVVK